MSLKIILTGGLFALLALSCGGSATAKPVVKEVPKEVVMEKEVVKEVVMITPVRPRPTMTSPVGIANPALGPDVIGEWRAEYNRTLKSRIKIFRRAGHLRLEESYDVGRKVTLTKSLIESQSPFGRQFTLSERPYEYFIIDSQGDLEVWGTSGLITIAYRLR